MFHRRSSLGGRKVSPPQPTVFTAEQKSSYLESLRNNRPARPTGSRPPPFTTRNSASISSQSNLTRSDSAPTIPPTEYAPLQDEQSSLHKPTSASVSLGKGRPLAQPPTDDQPILRGRKVSPTATVHLPKTTKDGGYVESTARLLEKEEAHNIREALDLIDQKDEEKRIYTAAQEEAADLVWKHRNPTAAEEETTAPYHNPDLKLKNRRRSSGQRQTSGTRKVSFPTSDRQIYEEPEQNIASPNQSVKAPSDSLPLRIKSTNTLPWLRKKPQDKSSTVPIVPASKKYDIFELHKNPRVQSNNAEYTANTPPPSASIDMIQEVDTPKSSPALEIRSEDIRAATSMKRKDRSPNLPTPTAVSDNLGRPIVSFDKSWKPPSDSPRTSQDIERPSIKLTEVPSIKTYEDRKSSRPVPQMPEITVSAPKVPTINLPEDQSPSRPTPTFVVSAPAVPTINLPDDPPSIPVINVQEDKGRALPKVPGVAAGNAPAPSGRPLPKHSATVPTTTSPHKTPSTRVPWLNRGIMPTVSCSSCNLPISGRIVTAAGSTTGGPKARLHPECFACHHCSTPLECVSFYPEPENRRNQRLEDSGLDLQSPEAAEDPLRFYCHLDFHEFFSPRCRSCKTPIEGEVIVAAGSEWHVGHFFCGECGDPFDSTTPFVERDGYAYCVRCHTKRTSARCKECKNQILDELTVEALGGKYHEKCFSCFECGDGFGDEGRFFIRDVPVEPTDKEKRKGIMRKLEEKPVCGPCEERRLKA